MTTRGSPAARELARELLERETESATGARLGAAMDRASTRLSEQLRSVLGQDGFSALLDRAIVRTQSDEPLLREIHRADGRGIQLDVITAAEIHGAEPIKMALESLFAALVDILGELIGMDMVRSLLDHDGSPRTSGERRTQ